MSYVASQPRKRFHICLNDNEREQIITIMKSENIPDAAKAVRYCIAEKAQELQKQGKTGQKVKAVKHE